MSTIRAYLGTSGLTDTGYRFYTQNTAAAARVTTGIVDEGEGWYSAAGITLLGDHVRWDSTGTADAVAREDLAIRKALESMPRLGSTYKHRNVVTNAEADVIIEAAS